MTPLEIEELFASCTFLSAPSKRSMHAPAVVPGGAPAPVAKVHNSGGHKKLSTINTSHAKNNTTLAKAVKSSNGLAYSSNSAMSRNPLPPHLRTRLASPTATATTSATPNKSLPPHLRQNPTSHISNTKVAPASPRPLVRRKYTSMPFADVSTTPTAHVAPAQQILDETPLMEITGHQALLILSAWAQSGQLSKVVEARRYNNKE